MEEQQEQQETEVKKIKRVGVLRGGAGKHYSSSLKKGGELISHISENLGDKYKTVDILIDKDYIWHINGVPINPGDLTHRVDIIWNTSHPSFSNILESLSIPNIGVGAFYYALQNNRDRLGHHVKSIGVRMPQYMVLPLFQKDFERERYAIDNARGIFEKFGSPWRVKFFTPEENVEANESKILAQTFPELVGSIGEGLNIGENMLVEEFVKGKMASMHSVPTFRGDELYVFPISNRFGNSNEPTEADFSLDEKKKLANLAKALHKHLGAKHYLKADFILNPHGKVYLLQVESIPDLKPDSAFSHACDSVGAKMHYVIEHILDRALD